MAITERSDQNPPQLDDMIRQDGRTCRCTAELGRIWIEAARSARRGLALAPTSGLGPSRRAPAPALVLATDQTGSPGQATRCCVCCTVSSPLVLDVAVIVLNCPIRSSCCRNRADKLCALPARAKARSHCR